VAKPNGKGRLKVFESSRHAAAVERLSLESDLRRAIEREAPLDERSLPPGERAAD
jgi:hypothetical protein